MDSTEIKKQQAAQAAQAEVCFSRYEWAEAIACFDAILQVEPNNRAALDGKRKAQGQQGVDAQIQADLATVRKALEAGRYTQARTTLDQAQARGADSAILKYHAEIDRLREIVQEREGWQTRVKEALAQASQLQATQAGAEALRVLNALLRDLAASGLDALGQDARGLRDRLQAAKDLDDQMADVNRAKIEQDYRRAFELVATLREQYQADTNVQRLYREVNRIWSVIQQKLTDAEQAVKDERLDDAVALLGDLRNGWPNNPDWKALWLRAHMDHGRARAEAGRQAIQGHTFDNAKAAFETAQTAFQAALDVYPDHPSAGPARDEVRALKDVAVFAGQAERELRQSRWEAGRGALQSARAKLAEAQQVRRREFSEIAAVLEALWGGVNETVEAIQSARGLRAEGEHLLTHRELGKAEERFRKGLERAEGRDEDLKQALLEGLRRAERAREGVEKLLTAAEAADAAGRVELLEQVYSQWPTAPGMPGLLVQALLQAAVAARAQGDGAATAAFCERVQTLPEILPAGVEQARRILAELNAQQQTQATLAEAARGLRELEGQPLPSAAGYQALVELLLRGRETAKQAPEFSDEIARRLAVAQERQRRLATAEPLLARAAQAQGQGQWAEAVAALAEAVAALAGVPAPEPAQRLARWQQTATAVASALQTAGAALAQAQAQYLAARDELGAVDWPALDQFLALARRALAGKPAGAETVPPAWAELQNQLGDLQVRSELLRKAAAQVQAGQPMEALPTLAAAAAAWPDDPVLGSTLARLKLQTAEAGAREAERLVREARAEVDRGEWTSALAKLSRAKEYSAATSVADELRRLEQQITLWQRFQEQDLAGTAARNNTQPQVALAAFRAALRTALEADSGLPDAVRDILAQLLDLENQLHNEQADQTARQLRGQLLQVAMQNRLVSAYVSSTVRSWYDLASRQAREGFVISRIELAQLDEGFKAAVAYVNEFPQDVRALELASQARERLLNSVLHSARKRLGRAEELRAEGVYDQAAAALADIEKTVLGPIEAQFPELFRDDEDIDELRRKVSKVELELQAIQAATVKLAPLVGRIREAYAGNRLEEAQQLIVEAGLADSGKRAVLIWREIEAWRVSMLEQQQEKLRSEAQAALDGAEVNLLLAQTVEAARAVIQDLEDLRSLFTRLTGAAGEALRQRWTALAGRAQMRWDESQRVGYALQTAAAAKSPEARLTALERAAAAALGQERERILAQIDELKRDIAQAIITEAAARPAELAKLLREAESLFRQGKFDAARAELGKIFANQPDHAKAEELLVRLDQADQAAVLLGQARTLRSGEQYESALNLVTQALRLHPENVEAGLLQAQLPTELAAGKHLARARSLAKENQFAEARAELAEARKENPNHPRLVEVQAEIRRLETNYRDAMLQPVEAARWLGDYRGMLQQYTQIFDRAATAELRTEVQQKQQATVDQWVDTVLEQGRTAFKGRKPLDELLAARDLMCEVAALTPAPSERRLQTLNDLIKQIETERLLARLAEGQQAFAAGSFDIAMQTSDEVLEEARPLRLTAVVSEADRLSAQAHEARKEQQERTGRMNEAWAAALAAWAANEYENARRHLAKAQTFGKPTGEIALYQQAVHAGLLLRQAEGLSESDLLAAQDLFRTALEQTADCPPASELRWRIQTRLQQIERDVVVILLEGTRQLLTEIGFAVQTAEPLALMCTSDMPQWSRVSPFFVWFALDRGLNREGTQAFCAAAERAFGGSLCGHTAAVIMNHPPNAGDLSEIMALCAHEKFTVIPLQSSRLLLARHDRNQSRMLQEQIDLYLGRTNPYNIGHPVTDTTLAFFGRRSLLAELEQRAISGQPAVVFGVSKIGKTSLLWRLREECAWPVAVVDLRGVVPLEFAYTEILKGWLGAIGASFPTIRLPDWTASLGAQNAPISAYEFRRRVTALLHLLAARPGGPGLVLVLDDVDGLLKQPGYAELAGALRGLADDSVSYRRLSVFATGLEPAINRAAYIGESWNPFYAFFSEVALGPFDLEDARTMIVSIGEYMGITYDDEALAVLVRAGGGHPYLTRQLCSRIVAGLTPPERVDVARTVDTLRDYLREPETYLEQILWDMGRGGPSPAEEAVLHALAMNQPQSEQDLLPSRLQPREREARQIALKRLCDRSLVSNTRTGFVLTIPLFRDWIRSRMLDFPAAVPSGGER